MTINICNPPIGYVEIGRMGENLYRELNIDVSAWLAELPSASVSVVFRRPDGQDVYKRQVPVCLDERPEARREVLLAHRNTCARCGSTACCRAPEDTAT